MTGGGFEATRIIVAIEVGSDLEAGLCSGGAGVVENLLIGVEWFAGPVSRDFGEEAMLDGVPFRSTCRVMSHCHGEGKRIGQLGLDFRFPGMTSATIAAAGIGENKQLA